MTDEQKKTGKLMAAGMLGKSISALALGKLSEAYTLITLAIRTLSMIMSDEEAAVAQAASDKLHTQLSDGVASILPSKDSN